MPIGRACASSSRRATRRPTATRTPTARAACATSSSRCGSAAPGHARCSRPPLPSAGASPSARSRRAPRGRAYAVGQEARLRRTRGRCRGFAGARRLTRCSSRSRARSATSARATSPIVDLFDITTGNTTYGQDVKLPGMKFAVIARPPVVRGKVASYDASATMKVPGVVKVVEDRRHAGAGGVRTQGGVAVIAKNTWAALKGRDALKIDLGRRAERLVRFGRLQGDARGGRAQARQDRAQRG